MIEEAETKKERLKEYFKNRDDVLLAFIFGSQAKGYARRVSDWDIGVYFASGGRDVELESEREIPGINAMWRDVENIVGSEVDLVILNNAAPALVFSVLNGGIPLLVRSRPLYLRLLLKTSYEAIDFWRFTDEFFRIRERSRSLSAEDRSELIKHLVFLENEFADLEKFKKVTQMEYTNERDVKRNIERWVEDLVMASLDIAKIVLASEKKAVPDSYRDTLRGIGLAYFDESFAKDFSEFASLRNIVAHEYLDLRWKRIKKFIGSAENMYPRFLSRIKEIAEEGRVSDYD